MTGETDLKLLLSTMTPVLNNTPYVFTSIEYQDSAKMSKLTPLGSFREKEGITLILEQQQAEDFHLGYQGVFYCITLNVHSSLEAVGLTAAISTRLAQHSISANVVAGYYHDHIFVAERDAESALTALQKLSQSSAEENAK